MKKQKKKSKSTIILSIAAAVLILVLILFPEYASAPVISVLVSIGLAGCIARICIPLIAKKPRSRRSRRKEFDADTDKPEGSSDVEALLWRQISFQITDKLKAAYPEATWEFTRKPNVHRLLNGKPLRIRTFHTDSYNFAEVSLDTYGNLDLTMMTLEALTPRKRAAPPAQPGQADPKSWYTLIGKPYLQNLIGDLQAKGHQKLFIKESGEVFILNGGTPEKKGCLDHFPPRSYWAALTDIFVRDELRAKESDNALEISWI